MILNEMKGHIRNAIGYLRERPFGQDKIDNATEEINKAIESINHKENIYLIELDRFNIYNNNTNATETTIGINNAIIYAKENGYTGAKLPRGHYAIDTSIVSPITLSDGEKEWKHNRKGIIMQSNMDFIMNDAVLEMIPTDDPYYSVFTISNCNNSRVIGGTILGDRKNHNFGMRINNDGNELEAGSFDGDTGLPIEDDTKVRTKEFVIPKINGKFVDEFILICLENTTKNTTDGGVRYIYCYDENDNYLGIAPGDNGNSFWSRAKLVESTKKIKVSFRNEKRLDAKYYITTNFIYPSHEFATGISIAASNNIEINNVVVKDMVGDCMQTFAPPLNVSVDDLIIKGCTLENARRQGISFVGSGERYLIENCNIGKIGGVDPQSGIDFEHYGYVRDVVINNSNFYDNKKVDILNYNGCNIEIKNCNLNGNVTSTFGYNMDVHDNKFIYEDNVDKIFKGSALGLGTNKDYGYFRVYNNYFEGYNSAGGNSMSNLPESIFTNNTIVNSHFAPGDSWYGNTYIDSTVRYTALEYEYKDEKLTNCIITTENNGENKYKRYFTNFELTNCSFSGGAITVLDTVFDNCNIYNDDKTFCNGWAGKYTIINSNIETKYIENIPFIEQQACENTTFENNDMNLSVTPFIGVNYKQFNMKGCRITFNESYKANEEIYFFDNGNENKCTFYENEFTKDFDSPKITLPPSSIVNDVYYEEGVTV